MSILNALILGVVQGITEFLPISSSGHLILAEEFMKLDVESLKAFDISLHVGTLLAILIYFAGDFVRLAKSAVAILLRKKVDEADKNMLLFLALGTLPALFVGALFENAIDGVFRGSVPVAINLIVVGLWFFVAEYIHKFGKEKPLNLRQALLVGVAQAAALIPGVSRSGITISSGIATGLSREAAARFSFLLGSIAMAAAAAMAALKALNGDFVMQSADLLITGMMASLFSGLLAITFLMRFLKKHSLNVFGVYRILLGIIILFFFV